MSIRAINHPLPTPTSRSFSFITLLAKSVLDLAMLIFDKHQRFESILSLQGKPNHTTYGHSRSPTWQPFTSSHRSHHRRILPKDNVLTYLRTVASRPLSACSQSLPSKRGKSIQ